MFFIFSTDFAIIYANITMFFLRTEHEMSIYAFS